MNLKIYEKEVMYRINSKYKSQRSIGEYIRKERLSQGLKQELVCKGICSVSYYSRIESNKVSPSRLYINKILGKLNKAVPSNLNNDSNQNNKELVNNLLTAMEYKNNKIVDEVYIKIKHNQDINQELYEFIYSIYYMKISHIPPLINSLHQQQIHFDNEELLLYLENLGTYYALTNKYNDAEKCLKMSIKLQNHSGLSKPSILYRYAWVLGKMSNDYQSLKYAEDANTLYLQQNNVYRSIQCKILIAIKLSKYFPDKAIAIYNECLTITNHSNFNGMNKIIYFNLAIVYKKMKEFNKSEKLLLEILEDHKDDNLLFRVYIEIIDICIQSNKLNSAKKYYDTFSKYLSIKKDTSIFLKYFDYKLSQYDINDKIQTYKNIFIPYFLETKNYDMLINTRLELISIYKNNNLFLECIEEYEKLVPILINKPNKGG